MYIKLVVNDIRGIPIEAGTLSPSLIQEFKHSVLEEMESLVTCLIDEDSVAWHIDGDDRSVTACIELEWWGPPHTEMVETVRLIESPEIQHEETE